MKKICYLGYYDTEENRRENRSYVLAATNKMTYICSALNRAGWSVEIVSASGTKTQTGCPGGTAVIRDGTTLRRFPAMGSGNVVKRVLGRSILRARLFWYLCRNTKRGDPVLVYHSLGYVGMLRVFKKIKGIRLILEVEEIYGDVTGRDKDRRREMKLFQDADAYIFPTELLEDSVNQAGKPSVVIYGTYQVEKDRGRNVFAEEFCEDAAGTIHCVYAGTLDPRKGGAMAAAAAAEYLPENYHIHILGFGSEKDMQSMKNVICETAKKSKAKVTYDGLLSGEEYIRFLQSCEIGLSTQNPDAAFNATSFPSKILSYLANGLRVVSIRIPAVERSAVGGQLYYYDEQTPQKIAEAVMSVDASSSYDSRSFIHMLSEQFEEKIKKLLNEQI